LIVSLIAMAKFLLSVWLCMDSLAIRGHVGFRSALTRQEPVLGAAKHLSALLNPRSHPGNRGSTRRFLGKPDWSNIKLRILAQEPGRVVTENLDQFLLGVTALTVFQGTLLQRERAARAPVGPGC
jgi:hypothetical protein